MDRRQFKHQPMKYKRNNKIAGLRLPILGVEMDAYQIKKIVVAVGIFLLVGIALGVGLVWGLDYPPVGIYLMNIKNASGMDMRGMSVFVSRLVVYVPLMLIVFFVFFVPKLSVASFLVVVYRGMLLGFSAGFLSVREMVVLMVPQNMVLVGCLFFLIRSGIKYIDRRNKVEYVMELAMAVVVVGIVSLYEAYVLGLIVGVLL